MQASLPLTLAVLAGCASVQAAPLEAPLGRSIGLATGAAAPPPDHVVALRAAGPSALPPLLARYDALPPGAERDALAETIDQVAGQRYATSSRLYWYTELPAAQAAAEAQGKPILALRMLGRLDEELSCANSRFFRTALYANRELSAYLRSNFVLFWSSERPVPRVTIDFGDGRKLVRTTTGNSAHYVLDASGHVLDVLPGLYAPSVFQAELGRAAALAAQVRGRDEAARVAAVRAYHHDHYATTQARFDKISGTQYIVGSRALLSQSPLQIAMVAQRATMSKAAVEVRDLTEIGILTREVSRDDRAAWATAGQRLFGIETAVLDAQSRALVTAIHDGAGEKLPAPAMAAVLARFEQSIVADTALNEMQLRSQIHQRMATTAPQDFASLNDWIYAEVFATPKSDPWLNLLPRSEFSGLPGDGAVMP